jgi:NAD-dependent SIR2 family protein deacetylase
MATTDHPTPALHLIGNTWVASCPTCGWVLTTSRRQDKAERRALRLTCPVCYEAA